MRKEQGETRNCKRRGRNRIRKTHPRIKDASTSTTVQEEGVSNALGRASASTTAEEANASDAAGRASASTTA